MDLLGEVARAPILSCFGLVVRLVRLRLVVREDAPRYAYC
jgi:hypothetical protein